ncbi:MAG: hypothetical protein IBX68_08270 [Dehalococcoidia bacterium]|nr:hypothetical protein [Dehalococcoidia bacterium]
MGFFLNRRDYRDLVRGRPDLAAATNTQPGDLILVRTSGVLFAAGRKLTRNRYDHIAVVLEGGRTLNIILPKAVVLPVSAVTKPVNEPLVLRPAWQTPEQRARFLAGMDRYKDVRYHTRRSLIGIFLSCVNTWTGLKFRLKKPDESAPCWICTEAIIAGLLNALPAFEPVNTMRLDYNLLGFATTNDFLRIARDLPQVLGPIGGKEKIVS